MHTARNAVREAGVRYKRHQPELTLLYQIIETYYPEFLGYMESQGKTLPTHNMLCRDNNLIGNSRPFSDTQ